MPIESSFRLPNGESTIDGQLCADTWRKLGNDLCLALGAGWRLIAFDPSLRIVQGGTYRTLTFDVDIAERIIELYERALRAPGED